MRKKQASTLKVRCIYIRNKSKMQMNNLERSQHMLEWRTSKTLKSNTYDIFLIIFMLSL